MKYSFEALSVFMLTCCLCHSACGKRKPPLSPEQALDTFQLPPGFRIELVAAEPDVVDPVAMAFDEQGRLFVVEMPDYPLNMDSVGRVKLLEDRDGDGRFEWSTIFADQLQFPNGVMPWREGILVTAAPDILYFADTDGDNRADVRQVVLTGFAATNPQLRLNGLLYGIDNWIYAAYRTAHVPRHYLKEFGDQGEAIRFPDHPEVPPVPPAAMQGMDVRFQFQPPKVEPVAGNSQFGNAFSPWGNRFTVWNNDHIRHVVIQNPYLTRNPYLAVPVAMQSASDHKNAADVYSIAEDFVRVHELEMGHFTSACGISVYTGGHWPAAYQGNFFVCEPVHHIVHRDILVPNGPTFTAKRAREEVEFLASTDGWFSPVFTTTGPDGALYVVDFYRQTVEHPEYANDLLDELDFSAGTRYGRIYRVLHDSTPSTPGPRLRQASSAELVQQLSNPNMWWRIAAQQLLVQRQDRSVVALLQDFARRGSSDVGRAHALWTLEGLGALHTELVLETLGDDNPELREQAVRLAETRLSESKVTTKVLQMASDPDQQVQLQVACTLGELPPEQSFLPLKQIAYRHLDDKWFQIAVLTSAAQTAGRWFRAVTSDHRFLGKQSQGKEEFLSRLTSIIGARQQGPEIASLLGAFAKGRTEPSAWWQAAGLKGLTSGLRRGSASAVQLSPQGQRWLLELVRAKVPSVKNAALEIAEWVELKESPELRGMIQKASAAARSQEADAEARVYATRILGIDSSGASVAELEELITPKQPQAVQIAAVNGLARRRDPKVDAVLLDQWRAYTGPVREAVAQAFFRDRARLPVLLDAIAGGKVQPWSLSPAWRRRLLRSSDEQIRERARTLIADASREQRKQVFEQYLGALRLQGSPERGRQVFEEKICHHCHKIGNLGYEVGPDLLAVAHRPKKQLLRDILMPNEVLEAGYAEYLVETTDGRSVSGIMAEQTPTTLTLRRAQGEQDTILRSNVAELRSLGVSSMPDDVEKDISVEAMGDLLAYIKSL